MATFFLLCIGLLAGCTESDRLPPTVILVSLDGFRWDYLDRPVAPTLQAIARRGVRADGLIPVFPSKTFPNHYSMVTGLYPEHHGLVANNMYDPTDDSWYGLGDREAVGDSRWYGGEPVWVAAERAGQLTAPLFWPGSEAEIGGYRPRYWRPFDFE
ncbi:MAG: ectonucleotide pyrophosphatase/phosphodiesterase, partial [Gemmatimonadales bacterium]